MRFIGPLRFSAAGRKVSPHLAVEDPEEPDQEFGVNVSVGEGEEEGEGDRESVLEKVQARDKVNNSKKVGDNDGDGDQVCVKFAVGDGERVRE